MARSEAAKQAGAKGNDYSVVAGRSGEFYLFVRKECEWITKQMANCCRRWNLISDNDNDGN